MPKILSKRQAQKNAPKTLLFELIGAAVKNDQRKVKQITAKYRLSHSKMWLDGCALVHRSLAYDDPDVVRFLKEMCTRLTNSEEEIYILHDAVAKSPKFLPLVKLLLTQGASVNARNANGDTPLHCVKFVSTAKLLLTFNADSPPDVNAVNSAGRTPLHAAAKAGNTRIIDFLVKNGADVNRSSSAEDNFNTPLHDAVAAVTYRHSLASKALLKAGADINARNSCGETALHLAVGCRSVNTLQALLSSPEVDVDVRDSQGNTAANRAAKDLSYRPLLFLLLEGADVNVPNNEGLTPVQIGERMRSKATGSIESSRRYYILKMSMALRSVVAMLKCARLPVNEDNMLACQCTRYENEDEDEGHCETDYTSETLHDPDFVKRCTNEVERMKNHRIGDSCITYYDVLSGSRRQVATYTKNASVSRVMAPEDSASARSKFDVYGHWIAGRYRRAKGRAKLQDVALASLSAIFEFLPGLCIDRIIDFLSNEDLKKCSDTLSDPDLDL